MLSLVNTFKFFLFLFFFPNEPFGLPLGFPVCFLVPFPNEPFGRPLGLPVGFLVPFPNEPFGRPLGLPVGFLVPFPNEPFGRPLGLPVPSLFVLDRFDTIPLPPPLLLLLPNLSSSFLFSEKVGFKSFKYGPFGALNRINNNFECCLDLAVDKADACCCCLTFADFGMCF